MVVKRSGQRVNFNGTKIAVAIKKAFDSIYINYDENGINDVYQQTLSIIKDKYNDRKTISVEDIQDIIEQTLQTLKFNDAYVSFNEYRKKREISRNTFSEKQQHKFLKIIEKIVQDNNLQGKKYESSYETVKKFGKIVTEEYAKSYLLDNKVVRLNEDGSIYIHELSSLPVGIFQKVYFKPKNFIFNDFLLNNYINDLKSVSEEISNEIKINNLEKIFFPIVLECFHNILFKNIKFLMEEEGLIDYINVKRLTELINKQTELPKENVMFEQFYANKKVKNMFTLGYTYTKYELEQYIYDLINNFLILLDNKHLNKKYTISFGIANNSLEKLIQNKIYEVINNNTLNINICLNISEIDDETINKILCLITKIKNLNLCLSCDCEMQYFADGTYICDEENKSDGRLLVNTVSINMARLALNNSNSLDKFYQELEDKIEIVKNNLIDSFELIGDRTKESYKVLFNGNIYNDEKLENGQQIRKVIKDGQLNIGLIGLYECIKILSNNEQESILINILELLSKKCKLYSEKYKLHFALCEPIDLKARKDLISVDKAIFGTKNKIIDKNFYDIVANLPFLKNDYKKIATIQKYFNGGEFVTISINGEVTEKKLHKLLSDIKNSDLMFVNLKIKGNDLYED